MKEHYTQVAITFVDLNDRYVVDVHGYHYGITDLLDKDGDNTDDPSQAVFAIGVLSNGFWFRLDLTLMEVIPPTRN